MKIKVCGLRDPGNIKAVAALQPDYMGFICYEKSPRYVGQLSAEALRDIPEGIMKTGVFVNETKEAIEGTIAKFGLDAIQLHGDESPEFCKAFLGKVEVLKAFGLDENFDFDRLEAYQDCVDYFLFDTKTAAYGGSGKVFDWGILDNYKLNKPFFLSGGIGLDNLEQTNKITHPQFYGADLNSKFETTPGLKDIDQLKKAFKILKAL